MEMDKLESKKIAIIGVGHMGNAITEGFIKGGLKPSQLILASRRSDKLTAFSKKYAAIIAANNRKAAGYADYCIIAVKPYSIKEVFEEIQDQISKKIIISVAAGITIAKLHEFSGNKEQKIVRIMPNLPVAYRQGVIGIYTNEFVTQKEKISLQKILSVLGTVITVSKEEDLNTLTVLSGSGPAIVAYFISILSQNAQAFGFKKEQAEEIVFKTFIGTLQYLLQKNLSADRLIQAVATKGGITQQIITDLNNQHVKKHMLGALQKGIAKITVIEKTT